MAACEAMYISDDVHISCINYFNQLCLRSVLSLNDDRYIFAMCCLFKAFLSSLSQYLNKTKSNTETVFKTIKTLQ